MTTGYFYFISYFFFVFSRTSFSFFYANPCHIQFSSFISTIQVSRLEHFAIYSSVFSNVILFNYCTGV